MTESSWRTWGSVRIAPGPAGLKTRPDKPVSGHGRRAAHYRVNRDARASGVRFAELNSQHSLSLVKRGPGTLPSRPRRPRHERARRGQDRGCRHPPAQAGASWYRLLRADLVREISGLLRQGDSSVSPRFLLHCAFEAPIGEIRELYPLAGGLYTHMGWYGFRATPAARQFYRRPGTNLDCGRSRKLAYRSHILRQIRHACSESIGPDVLAEDFIR